MKKKIFCLLCSVLVLMMLSSCGGKGSNVTEKATGTETKAETKTVQSATFAVTVTNVSGYNFQELYVSPTGANDWGEDQLGSTNILKSNGSYDIAVDRYDFGNYDVMAIDEDGDKYEFKYVPLSDDCEMQIGFDENYVVSVVVIDADGTENSVSGTLNGGDQEQQPTGAGYDTNGQFTFNVHNDSNYDIYALYMGSTDVSSDQDIDVLSEILPANGSVTITGQAATEYWSQTDWTLYVEDVDGDTSASFDSFDPWRVIDVNISWQNGAYVCDFTY